MEASEEILKIIRDRGQDLNRDDLTRIENLMVEIPMKESDQIAMIEESIALIVNDPLYAGDIAPLG